MKIDLIRTQRSEVKKLEEDLKKASAELIRLENEYAKTFQAGELVFFQPEYPEDEKKPAKFLITGVSYIHYLDNPQYVITGIFQHGQTDNPFEVKDIISLVKPEDTTF
jgi:hypothetical protein